MKFSEMKYERPNTEEAVKQLNALAVEVKNAQDGAAVISAYQKANKVLESYQTQGSISYIRYTIDTRDEFYSGENDFFDESNPIMEDRSLAFYRAVLASPHKSALSEKYGDILLKKMENSVKSSDERLIPLQQEENALSSQYQKLYASAKIPFMGKELTVAQMTPHKMSTDRDVRKAAIVAEGEFFDSHREELDEIYDKMVKNRTEQAKLLGYESFTPLGDIRMERLGYTREDIKACRKAVENDVVPYLSKLIEVRSKRIGVDEFHYWDDMLAFKDGNPSPKGTPEEILAAGQKMYHELSPETAEFIDFMMERDLFDVLATPGKAPGGYCTYLPDYKAPFIFSNFNGTSTDVDVLTHEAGHAFAAYVGFSKNQPMELLSPGIESCEIHSMGMEFLTSDYHELFFKEDTAKYALAHAEDAIFFLPYGCMVDEFQEKMYDEPNLTPQQRNDFWMELEHRYRPWNKFADVPFYSRGAGWQFKMHIYNSPFYYIDYVLAQTIALEFFALHLHDKKDAWQRYLALVNKCGTESYTGLVHAAGLKTPFEEGAMANVGEEIYNWIIAQNA